MKAWSISTTIRNPERIPDFLLALVPLLGRQWNKQTQMDFYISAISQRVVTPTLAGLTTESVKVIQGEAEVIPFEIAARIFQEKEYEDPPMRGRTQISPLVDLSLANTKDKVELTGLGRALLAGEIEFSEVMMNFDFKFQVPQPNHKKYRFESGYSIKPFVGCLALISEVNRLMEVAGKEPVGLSWEEFCIFVPTLVNYKQIGEWADIVVQNRRSLGEIPFGVDRDRESKRLIAKFLTPLLDPKQRIDDPKIINNLFDYGDNSYRYFKQSRFLRLRGGGNYVDISPASKLQAEMLIEAEAYKPLNFASEEDYENYLQDLTSFIPPWATAENSRKLEAQLTSLLEARGVSPESRAKRQSKTDTKVPSLLREDPSVAALRKQLTDVTLENLSVEALSPDFIRQVAEDYEKLARRQDTSDAESKRLKRPAQLEYLSFKALLSINDLERIQPNYPTDDEGNPVFTAGAGVADIEAFYKDFNLICEVTMLNDRQQWVAEGQPVQRHLFEFSREHSDKDALAIFLAPVVHRDTRNTFKQAYHGGYDSADSLKIIPFDFSSWNRLLNQLIGLRSVGKDVSQQDFYRFLESLLPNSEKKETTDEWWERISESEHLLVNS